MYVPIPCNVSTDWHRGRQIQDLLNGTGTMWLNHYKVEIVTISENSNFQNATYLFS